jgi:hypothetical protein
MANVFVQIAYAILVAAIYGLASYFKDHDDEHFNLALFLKTVLIGLFVGIVQFQLGLTYDQALVWVTTNAVLMQLIDKAVNAILSYIGYQPEPIVGGVPI